MAQQSVIGPIIGPVIGIILDEDFGQRAGEFSKFPYYALRKEAFDAIERAGGLPVGIPYALESFDAYIDLCDGWLMPGADYRFVPSWYDVPPPSDVDVAETPRQLFEAEIMPRLLKRNVPFLGICNGMQVLACVLGGALKFEDTIGKEVDHGRPGHRFAAHGMNIVPGSLMHQLTGATELQVNSTHREHVVRVAGGIEVTATAPDGGIEAIEYPANDFVLGVQWHAERDDGATGQPVLKAFIDAARKYSAEKTRR